MPRQYITTAIDYPNAAPHMGHVLEKVIADVIARWYRLQGHDVRLQIGTDEHGVKIQRAAQMQGISPMQLVDRNVQFFERLYMRLNLSHDKFIRTSNQQEHWPTVIELWKKLSAAGILQKRRYRGLYCSGCERFMTKRDLADGKCPDHQVEPEEVSEENWFFLLSAFSANLQDLLTSQWGKDRYRILPQFREKETLSLIDQGLEDISFSRPRSSLSWGIPVPGDEEQTMYVWCDALTNYISGLGYFTDHEEREWWDGAEVTHVIGKDIARFHALYWPVMLKNAEVRVPDRLLIHGFITSEGQKMSKSLGNIVEPHDVIEKFGVDPLRFYLSHEIPVGNDGDFSWDRFRKLYDAKLRHDIGNLLNRVIILLQKEKGTLGIFTNDPGLLGDSWGRYYMLLSNFDLCSALQIATKLAVSCNQFIDKMKPWELSGSARMQVLTDLAEAIRHLSLLLLPFMPETAQRMSSQLNVPYAKEMLQKNFIIGGKNVWGSEKNWKEIGEPKILFAPVENATPV